jgi:two-component system, NtrC family, response regulator GlrR
MPHDRDSDLPQKRPSAGEGELTLPFGAPDSIEPLAVTRFRISVVEGPHAGRSWESGTDRCSIGSHPSNDLVIEDPTVSRFHCEIRVAEEQRVRDLDSRNGTILDGVRIVDAYLRSGSLIRMGATVVSFQLGTESNRLLLSDRRQFGSLVGASVAMRGIFALLERAAASDATVLLEGETGTGKSQVAQSIHRESARKDRPFVTIDCGSIPANLLESELFGHERGAFTGAAAQRIGAFEEANGGTIFLDEIGELSPDLQPKLLRILENREIRRLGSNTMRHVNVRLVAATNRDLRTEVNVGRFRSDLFYRLAVIRMVIPPLRRRPDDIPILVKHISKSFGAEDSKIDSMFGPDFIDQLKRAAWPGNIRELRNYLERCLIFEDVLPVSQRWPAQTAPAETPVSSERRPDVRVPLVEARKKALDDFERAYLEELLRQHHGKMSQAADAAGIGRVYLYKLLVRHGLKK